MPEAGADVAGCFTLHPVLLRDTAPVCSLSLCRLLLMNDSRYPWWILVPEREGLRELDELDEGEWSRFGADLARAGGLMRTLHAPDKLNVAALGNMVPQLHIHLIARFREDAAWPHPVWGRHPPEPYDETTLKARVAAIRSGIGAV